MQAIGQVEAIFRYPVKSMRGEPLESAGLGWHGLEGDRRFAFRRLEDQSNFPWLTAGKLAELLRFTPLRLGSDADVLPTHVRVPDGTVMPITSDDLATEVGRLYGAPVQMGQLKDGIFDDASISVIASETSAEIARLANVPPDVRRFRPNIVIRLERPSAFQEDQWLGGTLVFGDDDEAPMIAVTRRDVRCSMINLDPDTAAPSPQVLKAAVRANDNNAGVYGSVTRVGRLTVGQPVFVRAASASTR